MKLPKIKKIAVQMKMPVRMKITAQSKIPTKIMKVQIKLQILNSFSQ